jgi:HK97 family phage major capsid protein
LATGTLEPTKVQCQAVFTNELLRIASPEAQLLIANELRNAIAVQTDVVFFNLILATISPTASTTGARSDFMLLLDGLSLGSSSKPYFVVSSSVAKRLSVEGDTVGGSAFPTMTPQGGTIGGVPVLVSDGLPSGYSVGLDASQIAVGTEGMVIAASRQAAVQLDTAPDSPSTASTIMRSLWQEDEVAWRAERYFGATRLRTTAVSAISGVNYSGMSPG